MPESINPNERLKVLRNRWWFPDHLHVRPLWRDLRETAQYARGRLLDLGCGNAPYRSWFEPRVLRYISADYPPVAPGVMVACSSMELPFQSASFDTVLCTQVLEHVPKPWIMAEQLWRIIKPGGVLILSCPQYWPLHEEPHDYFRFTIYGLKTLFPERHWEWLSHRQQGSTWAVISCSLWLSCRSFKRDKRLLALLMNPIFLLLDRWLNNRRETTNHLVVLRRHNPNGHP